MLPKELDLLGIIRFASAIGDFEINRCDYDSSTKVYPVITKLVLLSKCIINEKLNTIKNDFHMHYFMYEVDNLQYVFIITLRGFKR